MRRLIRSLPALAALAATTLLMGQLAQGAESLDELQEKAIKAAVHKVAPTVVQIETSGGTDVVTLGQRGLLRRGTGPTTGLIVDPDGYIVSSAFNFANNPAQIRVSIPGHKERYVAEMVATDQTRMLTLLKIDPEGGRKLPLPTPAPRAGIRIGQTALAIGRTLDANANQPPSVSVGIISAVNRIWGKAVQTDAKVSPTNYGGPLIDLYGRVMGVLVPASPQAEGETVGFEWYDSGIGFAIPLEDVYAVLPRLKKGTAKDPVVLKRGLLGITARNPDLYAATPVIGTVAPGSAAEKAGLKVGDVIKEIAGKPIGSQAQLMHQLGSRYEGDAVSLTVQRGKDEIKLAKVVLAGTTAYGQAFLGILPLRDDPRPGVEVRYVFAKSPADKAGLKEGDRIMQVGRQMGPGGPTLLRPLTGREQLTGLMETAVPGWEIKVEVRRKDKKKTESLTVTLGTVPDEVPGKLPENASAGKALAQAGARPATAGKKEDKENKKPETGLLKRTTAAADHTYWIYVPDNYDPNIAHALVIWLHPAGKGKEKDIDDLTWSWQPYCEDNHVILVCPRTENERGWTPAEADFIQEAVQAVTSAYTIDRRRVVAHGMGLGGEMAFYLGFHNRQLIRGVATVGAPLTSNPKERVVNQPLAFFLAAGAKDPLSKAIRESRTKLSDHKYPVIYREVPDMGHQYIDGKNGLPTLEELVRWIDALDRL